MYNLTSGSVPHDKKTGRTMLYRRQRGFFTQRAVHRQGSVLSDWQACWPEGRAVLHGTTSLCLPVPPLPAHLISFPTCLPMQQIQSSFFSDIPAVGQPDRHFAPLFPFVYRFQPHFPDVCVLHPFTWWIKKAAIVKDCISNSFRSFLTTIR